MMQPHLVSSTEDVEIVQMTGESLVLRNKCALRETEITVGGLAKSGWTLAVDREEGKVIPGQSGFIDFKIPAGRSATIRRSSSGVLQ